MTTSTLSCRDWIAGCADFAPATSLAARLPAEPELLERCIHLSAATAARTAPTRRPKAGGDAPRRGDAIAADASSAAPSRPGRTASGREFDFYLEHFPEEPGPREMHPAAQSAASRAR